MSVELCSFSVTNLLILEQNENHSIKTRYSTNAQLGGTNWVADVFKIQLRTTEVPIKSCSHIRMITFY